MNGYLGCTGEAMSQETSEVFLKLTMMEMGVASGRIPQEALDDAMTGLDGHLGYRILKKRLEVFKKHFNPTLDVSLLVQAFCAGELSETPAEAVMWAYTLNDLFVRTGKRVNIAALSELDAFPWGFPTQEEKDKLWDEQKVQGDRDFGESDNQVDNFKNWPVPREKKDAEKQSDSGPEEVRST